MIYTFHVGDYVSCYKHSNEVSTGYVSEYKTEWGQHCFVFQWDDGCRTGWSGRIAELPRNFIRIGQYSFNQRKDYIEKIKRDRYGATGSAVLDKIDELVDAVNELRKGRT